MIHPTARPHNTVKDVFSSGHDRPSTATDNPCSENTLVLGSGLLDNRAEKGAVGGMGKESGMVHKGETGPDDIRATIAARRGR